MNLFAQLDKLSNNAKVVFLIDAIGALLSALFIFIILKILLFNKKFFRFFNVGQES